MATVKYSIPNISCGHCVHTIKNEVGDLAGVKTVDGDIAKKEVTITFEAPATPEEIQKLLAEINYPVEA